MDFFTRKIKYRVMDNFTEQILTDTARVMSQERSVINGATAMFVSPVVDFYQSMSPFLLLALVLIVADTRFGVAAARKRGERIRPSRKWRRAVNKLVDYICWVTLAGIMGRTFGEVLGIPLLSALTLLLVYGIEISSCFNNYFEYRGIKKRVNVFKLFGRREVEEVLEDLLDKKKEEER